MARHEIRRRGRRSVLVRYGAAAVWVVAACAACAAPASTSAGTASSSAVVPAATSESVAASASATASPSTPALPEPSGPPAGLVAIGHSQLTGENSDPALPGQPVPANSWATGTNPAVRSIYQRMLQKWPDTQGKVANAAVGGATAAQLEDQAVLALQQVPNPRLVIIQTIDNDILCDGNDLAAAKMFGVTLDGALKRITSLAPQSRILLVSQPGRPVTDAKAVLKAAQTDPSWASSLVGGTGPCDVFTPQGRLREAGVRYLTSVITAFEAGQARVCARYARCSTDDGAVRRLVNTPKGVSSDHNHANVTGLAALAAAEWPSVLAALGD